MLGAGWKEMCNFVGMDLSEHGLSGVVKFKCGGYSEAVPL